MHENADLAGMKKAEVEQIKAFASRQVDRARPAYGRVREDRPRRSIEWGTTNNDKYLLSQTGNRRFWPLKTGKIDIEALKRDREQLLGEAAHYEATGESIMLDEKLWGAAREAQEQRRLNDPWEDILAIMPDSVTIRDGYAQVPMTIIHKSSDGYERVASADVLELVLEIPKAQQNPGHGQRLAHAMRLVGWERNDSGRVTINRVAVRGYIRRTPAPSPAPAPAHADASGGAPGPAVGAVTAAPSGAGPASADAAPSMAEAELRILKSAAAAKAADAAYEADTLQEVSSAMETSKKPPP
jgi:hypothetical protein